MHGRVPRTCDPDFTHRARGAVRAGGARVGVRIEETVTCMGTFPKGEDPLAGWGLRPVEMADRLLLTNYFGSLNEPLSDYTFSQIFTWRNSLRILWRVIEGHLCVFANGTGDLTLLLPPIGQGQSDRALRQAFELMDEYNASAGVPDRSRVEYASGELLARFDPTGYEREPLSADYVYDTTAMIELAGGDLKSKRQERNRFMRNHPHQVEDYRPEIHLESCLQLLNAWKQHQDQRHGHEGATSLLKRQKESLATELALRYAPELGLRGMVVHAADTPQGPMTLRGFTLGEHLGNDQASIVVEKTDLSCKGLAQFIFSEFCRRYWSDRPLINAGDDWGLQTLAWTKQSYRPVRRLMKWTLRHPARVAISLSVSPCSSDSSSLSIRSARPADLPYSIDLENACFDTYQLKKRQLQYLMQSRSSVFLVAEEAGKLIGQGIALIRQHRKGSTGRIYSLAVSPSSRGRGVGQRLLRCLIDALGARGVTRIYLEVERSNTSAIRLYEKNGFRTIGSLPDYYGLGRDAAHMLCVVPLQSGLFETSAPAAA